MLIFHHVLETCGGIIFTLSFHGELLESPLFLRSFSDDIYHQVGANIQSSDKVGLDRRHPTVPVTSSIHEELDSAAAFLRNNPFKADTNGSATVIYPNRLAQPTSMAKTNSQKVR